MNWLFLFGIILLPLIFPFLLGWIPGLRRLIDQGRVIETKTFRKQTPVVTKSQGEELSRQTIANMTSRSDLAGLAKSPFDRLRASVAGVVIVGAWMLALAYFGHHCITRNVGARSAVTVKENYNILSCGAKDTAQDLESLLEEVRRRKATTEADTTEADTTEADTTEADTTEAGKTEANGLTDYLRDVWSKLNDLNTELDKPGDPGLLEAQTLTSIRPFFGSPSGIPTSGPTLKGWQGVKDAAGNGSLTAQESMVKTIVQLAYLQQLASESEQVDLHYDKNHILNADGWYYGDNWWLWPVTRYVWPTRDKIARRILFNYAEPSEPSDDQPNQSNTSGITKYVSAVFRYALINGSLDGVFIVEEHLDPSNGKNIPGDVLDLTASRFMEEQTFALQAAHFALAVTMGPFSFLIVTCYFFGVAQLIGNRERITINRDCIAACKKPSKQSLSIVKEVLTTLSVPYKNSNAALHTNLLAIIIGNVASDDHSAAKLGNLTDAIQVAVSNKCEPVYLFRLLDFCFGGRNAYDASGQLMPVQLREQLLREGRHSIDKVIRSIREHLSKTSDGYTSACETLGFLGTLAGIILSFRAIPMLQMDSAMESLKSDTMTTVTSGLVLAFGTTFLAQGCKLVLTLIKGNSDTEIDALEEDFDYVVSTLVDTKLKPVIDDDDQNYIESE